jgi:hypothetical protein
MLLHKARIIGPIASSPFVIDVRFWLSSVDKTSISPGACLEGVCARHHVVHDLVREIYQE